MDSTYPFYIVDGYLVESNSRLDIPHAELWKKKIAKRVANNYGLDYEEIKDLCYAMQRGRVSTPKDQRHYSPRQLAQLRRKGIDPVVKVVFFGEEDEAAIKLIKKHYPDHEIRFDAHHQRQEDDMIRFQQCLDR